MSEKDGGPAWPTFVAASPSGDSYPGRDGMSLRDYFAGQALAGFGLGSLQGEHFECAGVAAYVLADALLKARTQGK